MHIFSMVDLTAARLENEGGIFWGIDLFKHFLGFFCIVTLNEISLTHQLMGFVDMDNTEKFQGVIERRLPAHYDLDARTIKDLGLHGLETNPCRQYLISDRGRVVYDRWVAAPLTDIAAVRDRQEIIDALAHDPEWLYEIQEYLRKIAALLHAISSLDSFDDYSVQIGWSSGDRLRSYWKGSQPGWRIVFGVRLLCYLCIPLLGVQGAIIYLIFVRMAAEFVERTSRLRSYLADIRSLIRTMADLESCLQQRNEKLAAAFTSDLVNVRCRATGKRRRSGLSFRLSRMLGPGLIANAIEVLTGAGQVTLYRLVKETASLIDATFDDAIAAISELECLVNAALLIRENNYTLPVFVDSATPFITIDDGHHPFILSTQKDQSVANSLSIGNEQGDRLCVISGQNKGGKTVFIKMVGLVSVLAQAGFGVPAQRVECSVVRIVSSMGINDSVLDSESLFSHQALSAKWLLWESNGPIPRFLLVDEIASGTSVAERMAFEETFVRVIDEQRNCLAMLTTHQYNLVDLAQELPSALSLTVSNEQRFKIVPGASTSSGAIQVLREVGYPDGFLEEYNSALARIGEAY